MLLKLINLANILASLQIAKKLFSYGPKLFYLARAPGVSQKCIAAHLLSVQNTLSDETNLLRCLSILCAPAEHEQ